MYLSPLLIRAEPTGFSLYQNRCPVMVREGGLDCISRFAGNQGCCQFLNWQPQMSTGHLHFDGFESPSIKKLGYPEGYPSFLVRERGLEPPRRNHTHLKRACLPFQHSRSCLSIITAGGKFVNRFFGKRRKSKITAGFSASRCGKAPKFQWQPPGASGYTTGWG